MIDPCDVRSLALTLRAGHHIHAHRHGWAQLLYARAGTVHATTPAGSWLVPPTRALWLPAGTGHALEFHGEVQLRTLYLRRDRAHPLGDATRAIEVDPLLRALILHVLERGSLDPANAADERLAGVLVDRIAAAPALDLRLPGGRDPRLCQALDCLRLEPARWHDLQALATQCGASPRTLQRLARAETGLTLDQWRQKARLVHAVARLGDGHPVLATALDCGYDSPSAFIAAFRRHFGTTPGRFVPRRPHD